MAEPAPIYASDVPSLVAKIESAEFLSAVGRKSTSTTYAAGVEYNRLRCDVTTYNTGSSGSEFSVKKIEVFSCPGIISASDSRYFMHAYISGRFYDGGWHELNPNTMISIAGPGSVSGLGFSLSVYQDTVLKSILVYFGL